ncbi:hypothetical protein P7C70_g4815, partial [Phenoliferia sp. Uapishka_3]
MSTFASLFPRSAFGERPVAILDGGMGTTLQAPPFNLPLDSSLWSSELLATDTGRAQLRTLHQLWVNSGAEVVGSCTYQSCLPLFLPPKQEDAQYTQAEVETAKHTMNSALPIVTRNFDSSPSSTKRTPIRSALSLGPFGAVLSPGQEYSGRYPPPYGTSPTPSVVPYSLSASRVAVSPLESQILPSSDAQEDALVSFHLSRLDHLSQSASFSLVSLLAFETIPIIREARAIRRAVSILRRARPTQPQTPFYLSFVFPVDNEGHARCPDESLLHLKSGSAELADAIIEASFAARDGQDVPNGIGVNCTSPLEIMGIIDELSGAISRAPELASAPWLVLYPDGGSVYDVVSRTWSSPDGLDDNVWASKVTDGVQAALGKNNSDGKPTFGGVLAGGCCKAGPEAISALRSECQSRGLVR